MCVYHPFSNDWLFGEGLFQEIFSAQFRFAKSLAIEHHADARAFWREWNNPKPAIDSANQRCQRAVDSFSARNAVVMREDRQLLEMIVSLLNSKLGAENGIASAGIDQVASADISWRTIRGEAKIDIFI